MARFEKLREEGKEYFPQGVNEVFLEYADYPEDFDALERTAKHILKKLNADEKDVDYLGTLRQEAKQGFFVDVVIYMNLFLSWETTNSKPTNVKKPFQLHIVSSRRHECELELL
jgi:hypothetical protein